MEPAAEFLARTITFMMSYWVLIISAIIAWAYLKYYGKYSRRHETPELTEKKKETVGQQQQPTNQGKAKKKQSSNDKWQRGKQTFTHDWVMTSLKGHSGTILDMDFSANGKFLATCGDDRTIFIWIVKSWKDKTRQNIRYNVEYDHASIIRWSPDSKAFLYNRVTDNELDVCKLIKKPDGKTSTVTKLTTFPKVHKDDMISLGISVNGKFFMTCSSGTEIALWDLKGNEITRFDSYLINNYAAKVSPCGNFVAASGFAPDVKFWEVCFLKTGEFKNCNSIYQLKGHESGVYDFSFTPESTQVATITKHGVWRLFNIKVEYKQGEEPKLLKTGKIKTEESTKSSISLSPDGQVLAVASKNTLTLVNLLTGGVDKIIPNIYTGGIQKVAFDAGGDYIITCGDRHVHVLHNVTGKRTAIASSKEKLSKSGVSTLTKERLEDIISNSQKFLKSLNETY